MIRTIWVPSLVTALCLCDPLPGSSTAMAAGDQGAAALGIANAGIAAGAGGLGAIFWNPAALTLNPGMQSYATLLGLAPSARSEGTAGTMAPLGLNSGEIGQPTL